MSLSTSSPTTLTVSSRTSTTACTRHTKRTTKLTYRGPSPSPCTTIPPRSSLTRKPIRFWRRSHRWRLCSRACTPRMITCCQRSSGHRSQCCCVGRTSRGTKQMSTLCLRGERRTNLITMTGRLALWRQRRTSSSSTMSRSEGGKIKARLLVERRSQYSGETMWLATVRILLYLTS